MDDIATIYTNQVDDLVIQLEETTIKNVTGAISISESLANLTQNTIDIINLFAEEKDRWENLMIELDFYVRQQYNIIRYRLDITVNAIHWNFYGNDDFVWSG